MTFVLELKAEIEEVLQRKAQDNGFEANVYLEKMIEKDIEHSRLWMKYLRLCEKSLMKAE